MKNKTNLLFLYSKKDEIHLKRLFEMLNQLGINIFDFGTSIDGDFKFKDSVKSIRVVAIFISQDSANSNYLMNEMVQTIESAKDRSKTIIPIIEYSHVVEQNPTLKLILEPYDSIILEDGLHSALDYELVVRKISKAIFNQVNKEVFYEIANEMIRLDYASGISENMIRIIDIIMDEINESNDRDLVKKKELLKELFQCIEILDLKGAVSKKKDGEVLKSQFEALNKVKDYFEKQDYSHFDISLISLSLAITYHCCRLVCYSIEVSTNGDVMNNPPTIKAFKQLQEPLFDIYKTIFNGAEVKDGIYDDYSLLESNIILNIDQYRVDNNVSIRKESSELEPKEGGDDLAKKNYEAIAEYMNKTNQLFELIGENNNFKEFLKCLKTSYERLKNYCELVGYKAICAECIEKIAQINQRLEVSEETDEETLADNSFKALLGFSVAGKDDFDVFISYKHEDADIATSIYHFFKSNLLNPFLDSFSLPELSKSEYEDAIMNALEHSKHFVVILSKLEYLNSFWVDLEMKTFRHEMVEGRKKDANFIIIVTNEVYEEIMKTNKVCLPLKYRSYEIMKVDTYASSIIEYIKNK